MKPIKTFWRDVTRLVCFLMTFAIGVGHADDTGSGKDLHGKAKKLVYEAIAKHFLITGDWVSKDAPSLDEKQRGEFKASLAGLDLGVFGEDEKQDFKAWRDSLVEILDKPPTSVFDKGSRSVDPMKKCMAVLANYDITGATAKADGYPQLSQKIDTLHRMAKTILLGLCQQDADALEKVPMVAKEFIEYFLIYSVLVATKSRNPIAQSALLAMDQATSKDEATKESFIALHESLWQLSHGTHGHPSSSRDQAALERNLPLVHFCEIVNKGGITGEDMEKGGAKQLKKIVQQFREIGEKGCKVL